MAYEGVKTASQNDASESRRVLALWLKIGLLRQILKSLRRKPILLATPGNGSLLTEER